MFNQLFNKCAYFDKANPYIEKQSVICLLIIGLLLSFSPFCIFEVYIENNGDINNNIAKYFHIIYLSLLMITNSIYFKYLYLSFYQNNNIILYLFAFSLIMYIYYLYVQFFFQFIKKDIPIFIVKNLTSCILFIFISYFINYFIFEFNIYNLYYYIYISLFSISYLLIILYIDLFLFNKSELFK